MTCHYSAAQAALFWPLCAVLFFVVIVAIIDGRQHRSSLRAAKQRVARLEQRLRRMQSWM